MSSKNKMKQVLIRPLAISPKKRVFTSGSSRLLQAGSDLKWKLTVHSGRRNEKRVFNEFKGTIGILINVLSVFASFMIFSNNMLLFGMVQMGPYVH